MGSVKQTLRMHWNMGVCWPRPTNPQLQHSSFLGLPPLCAAQQRPVIITSAPGPPATLFCTSATAGAAVSASFEFCGVNHLTLLNLVLEGCRHVPLLHAAVAEVSIITDSPLFFCQTMQGVRW